MMSPYDPITNKIISRIKKQYPETLISIFGIGSYFDQTLRDDWLSNDIDIIVILTDLDGTPQYEWTEGRYEHFKQGEYEVWVGYNTLKALKDKNLFRIQSFSNYEWSILELKYPHNSDLLFGQNIRNQLLESKRLEFDFDDILRRSPLSPR